MDNTPLGNGQQPVVPPYGSGSVYGTNAGANAEKGTAAAPVTRFDRFLKTIGEFEKEKKAGICVLLLFALFFCGFLLLNYSIYGGVLIPAGFLVFYAIFLVLIPKDRLRFDAVSILLLIACLFLYSTYTFNCNLLTNLVTAPVVIVLTGLLFMQQSGLDIDAFTLATPVEAARVYVSQALTILVSPLRSVGCRLHKKGKSTVILNVLIGIACTIPFVIVLTVLFTSADAVFKKAVEDFFKNFDFDDVFRIIGAIVLAVIVTFFVAPMLFSVVNSEEDEIVEKEKPSRLNSVAVCAFLIILTLLEGLFGIVQVRGLFAGRLPEYVNYAEYARSGFFHIAGATALTVAIIAGVYFICGKLKVSVKIMLTVFSATATILFASAYFRMHMYMTALGLTVKRVSICWLITLLLALLIGIVIKIWLPKKFPLFGYTVVAVTLFTIALGAMRLDTLVSKYNVDLYLNSKPEQNVRIDVNYLKELSPEALPQIVRLEGTKVDLLATRAEKVMAYKLENNYGKQCGINFNYGLAKAWKTVGEKHISYDSDDIDYWLWGGDLNYKSYDEEWEAENNMNKSECQSILNRFGIYFLSNPSYDENAFVDGSNKIFEIYLTDDEIFAAEKHFRDSGSFFTRDDEMFDFIFDYAESVKKDIDFERESTEYVSLYNDEIYRIVKHKAEELPSRFTLMTYADGAIRIYVIGAEETI
jgi:hypothetical protein